MARDFEDHCWRDVVDEETLEIDHGGRRRSPVLREASLAIIAAGAVHPHPAGPGNSSPLCRGKTLPVRRA
jgi:hypothetical protein